MRIVLNRYFQLYTTIFISGAAILIVEILGARIISPFYGATIFVWSSMITVALGGLAVGYGMSGRISRQVCGLTGAAFRFYMSVGLAGLFILMIKKFDFFVLAKTEGLGLQFGPLASSAGLYLIPFCLLGTLSPMAVRMLDTVSRKESSIGNVFAVGTCGSLVGALLAGFFLIPVLPVSRILYVTGWLLIGLGCWGLLQQSRRFLATGMLLAIGLTIQALPAYHPAVLGRNSVPPAILDRAQSFYGDLKLVRNGPYDCLYVNGGAQSCLTPDRHTDERYLEVIRAILSRTHPRRVLILGVSIGSVLTALDPGTKVDAVELDPAIVEMAKRNRLFPEFPIRLIYDDARHFLTVNRMQYDFILVDLSRGLLIPEYIYSAESLASMKRALNNNGSVFFHLSGNMVDRKDPFFTSIAKTIADVFGELREISLRDSPGQDMNFLIGAAGLAIEHPYAERKYLDAARARVITDDWNPLDVYFLSHAVRARQAVREQGIELFEVN